MAHYPTQEDELRTREAQADSIKQTEEAKFLSTFQTIPARNAGRLSELANSIVSNFNRIMDIMAGMKKLLEEQINVIEARRSYTIKINPSSALREEKKP
jgi:hypothetical protein